MTNDELYASAFWGLGGRATVFSDQLFRCGVSVLGLQRIERNALSAVVTRFQPAN
jgi:hypothetical protein